MGCARRWSGRLPAKAKPFLIGLTGSIGMGKSQTAALFAEANITVYDADAAIQKLYARGGAGVDAVGQAFPGAIKGGAVDRAALSQMVLGNAAALAKLEALVHPLVRADRDAFIAGHDEIVLLDIPLLFETGGAADVDAVVVASTDADTQRARVLSRPGMTEEKFTTLHARQVPDAQKRAQADYVVETGQGLDHARDQVKMILADIRKKTAHA